MNTIQRNIIIGLIFVPLAALGYIDSNVQNLYPVFVATAALPAVSAILWGRRSLVLLSFLYLSNIIYTFHSQALISALSATPLALLMTGFMLISAEVSRQIYHRFVGRENSHFKDPKNFMLMLLICGPLNGTIMSFTVIPVSLVLLVEDTWFAIELMGRWWIALTGSGAIGAIILFFIFNDTSPMVKRVVLSASALSLTLFTAIVWTVSGAQQKSIEQYTMQVQQSTESFFKNSFDQIRLLNSSLASFWPNSIDPTIEDFDRMVFTILQSNQNLAIKYVAWAPYVSHDDRIGFEQAMNCSISVARGNDSEKQARQPSYFPLQYVSPSHQELENGFCFDYLGEAERNATLRSALYRQSSTITPPLENELDQDVELEIFTPVVVENEILGVLVTEIEAEKLNANLADELGHPDLNLIISDYTQHHTSPIMRLHTEKALFSQDFHFSLHALNRLWTVDWNISQQQLIGVIGWQGWLFCIVATILVLVIQFISYRLAMVNETIKREVETQTAASEEAKSMAQHASDAKSRFLANMSHEIRTPLNAILGYADLARRPTSDDERQVYLDGIWSASEALLAVVNDILDFSKIEAGRLELAPEVFNIFDIERQLEAIFAKQAEAKGLRFEISCDASSRSYFYADAARIQQVLINLCSNAIKFTERGMVRVELFVEYIDGQHAMLHASIEDSGIGIDSKLSDSLFEEFTQAESGIARKFGGTGLGLSISRSLTELMQGKITVNGTLGKGTTFIVNIPLEPRPTPETSQNNTFVFTDTSQDILIVDDNVVNLKVTSALLKKSGCNVRQASSGQQAIDRVAESLPRLIFMDMQMPDMDGLEATRRLRQQYSADELIIVGLTANAAESDRQACLDAGMNDHLSKPVSLAKLSACLSEWLL